ncbi:hypothetical protein DFH09DRAFT_1319233 [Mycena vulgaris]|nr:hypothetical protein DFH09DRAFT_1319233 [Mycena vulgaris]
MPSRRKATLEEQLQVAQDQLRATEKKLKDALAAQAVKPKKLIPRPKGQAGKGSGYNLQHEICLGNNKARYNHIMRIVRYFTQRFLDTTKTISGQEKSRLEKTIKLIQKDVKYLQRFQGGWPIRDFIKQYLANNQDKYKHAIRQEREAEADDTDNWGASAQTMNSSQESQSGDEDDGYTAGSDVELDADLDGDLDFQFEGHEEDINTGSSDEHHLDQQPEDSDSAALDEFEDSAMDLEDFGAPVEPSPVKIKRRVKENISPIKPATPLAQPKKYKPKLKMNDDEEALEIHQELIGRKRKTVPIPEDNSRPPKKAKTSHTDNALPPPPPPPQIASFSPLTRADLPDTCPDASCKDLIPQNLSPTILTLFTRKRDLVTKDGPKAPGCQELTQKICEALRREAHLVRCVKHARQQGWPRIIDFDELPARILDLLPTLRALFSDSDALAESPVWTNFLHGIGYKVFAFSKSAAKFDTAYLGCGYFRPRGQVVIQKTLLTLLSDIDGVHTDLYDTLSRLIDAPKRWDSYDDSSNLISVTQFTKFVLIPHAALMLISDDLEIGVEESFEVLQGSREYGTLFNTEKSAERQHMDAPKIAPMLPLRHRKAAVNLLLPPQKMITLDDFPAVNALKPLDRMLTLVILAKAQIQGKGTEETKHI